MTATTREARHRQYRDKGWWGDETLHTAFDKASSKALEETTQLQGDVDAATASVKAIHGLGHACAVNLPTLWQHLHSNNASGDHH